MSTIYKAVTTFVSGFILILTSFICQAQETDAGCGRTWYMGKCENKALLEDFEERDEIYVTEEAMFSLIRSWTSSVLHCERFICTNHTLVDAYRDSMGQSGLPVKEDKSTIPEYFFEATYDCARDPVIRERENQNGDTIEEELYPSYLNLRLYFDGEQKELVKEWTVNSTIHLFTSLTNRMFKYESSLLRTEVPITNLLDEFEKKPVSCQVKPEKNDIDAGEEIDIVLSDFRDAEQLESREFNRILVSADEGEIINGEKSEAGSEYRVFRLNEQSVTVKYKAPKKGSAGSDRITVYNSCEILPTERFPLRTTNPDKQIASHELRLNHQGWTGTINLEITERFQCNAEKQTSELSRREVKADDENIYKAKLTIRMDDFDLTKQPSIPGTNLLKEVSGQMDYSYDEDHLSTGRSEKSQCHSDVTGKWVWVSPGGWNTRHETWSGQASRQIRKENINLLIAKDQNLDKAAMQDLQKQMQEAAKNMDMDAINKLKGQMVGMVQGDQESNSIPVIIHFEIVFDITEKDQVIKTYENKSYDACLGRFSEDESGTDNIELPIAMPMAMQMKGTYTRGKDGSDIITATINKTENSQADFYKEMCPDVITIIKGEITLERHKE